jgi:hypothetical protein
MRWGVDAGMYVPTEYGQRNEAVPLELRWVLLKQPRAAQEMAHHSPP